MTAPALLSEAPLDVYHGDPLLIELALPGDRRDHEYRSQVRGNRRDDSVLVEFDTMMVYDPDIDQTLVVLGLAGDSAEGALDSKTRSIPPKAVMDVQEYDETGKPTRTLCWAELKGIQDITR